MIRRPWVLAAYLVVVSAFLETGSRVALSLPRFRVPTDRSAGVVWRSAWMDRREHVDVYYGFDRYDPTLGWVLAPGLRGDGTFGEGSVSSNAAGMRGRREFGAEAPEGTQRIALLGDSFTFGDEVRDEETWAARLQDRLPATEVLNLGVHGYGQDQMLLTLVERGFRYHPDLVLVGFVRDDMYRNLLSFRDYAKPRMSLENGRLDVAGVPVPPPAAVARRASIGPRLLDLLTILRRGLGWRTGSNVERMEELTAAILDRIADEAAAGDAVTVFVYLPHSEELAFPDLELREEAFFGDYCEERAAFCLDLRPAFLQRIAEGAEIKVPGHWHATGHELVAESLATFLEERGLLWEEAHG